MNEKQNIIEMLEKALELAKKIGEEKPHSKEPGAPFCPVNGQEAFFISSFDGVVAGLNWKVDNSIIKNRYVFPTKEDAQKTVDRERAMRHFWKLAEDLNEGWEPDWNDSDQVKWFIEIQEENKRPKLQLIRYQITNSGMPCFKEEQLGKIAASKLSDDEIKAIFNVRKFAR